MILYFPVENAGIKNHKSIPRSQCLSSLRCRILCRQPGTWRSWHRLCGAPRGSILDRGQEAVCCGQARLVVGRQLLITWQGRKTCLPNNTLKTSGLDWRQYAALNCRVRGWGRDTLAIYWYTSVKHQVTGVDTSTIAPLELESGYHSSGWFSVFFRLWVVLANKRSTVGTWSILWMAPMTHNELPLGLLLVSSFGVYSDCLLPVMSKMWDTGHVINK